MKYVNLIYKGGALSSNEIAMEKYQEMVSSPENNSNSNICTIEEGTILFHGSTEKESFNPNRIVLGKNTLLSYFSENKTIASDYILGCTQYPTKTGYIHKFRVKKKIENLLIVSPYEKTAEWTEEFVNEQFCNANKLNQNNLVSNLTKPLTLSGIAFKDGSNPSQYAICNPNEWLEYVSTQRCIGMNKLSSEYNFSQS